MAVNLHSSSGSPGSGVRLPVLLPAVRRHRDGDVRCRQAGLQLLCPCPGGHHQPGVPAPGRAPDLPLLSYRSARHWFLLCSQAPILIVRSMRALVNNVHVAHLVWQTPNKTWTPGPKRAGFEYPALAEPKPEGSLLEQCTPTSCSAHVHFLNQSGPMLKFFLFVLFIQP